MEKFISYGEKKGCSYTELKSYKSIRNTIEVVDKNVKELSSSEASLYSARVILNGSEGLSYSNKDNFKELIDNAVKLAKIQDKKIKFNPLKKINVKIKTKYKINIVDINLEDKKKNILNLFNEKKNYKKISSLKFIYRDSKTKFDFLNSENRKISWDDSAVRYVAYSYAKEGSRIESFIDTRSGHKGYELFKNESDKMIKYVLSMGEEMLKSKNAKAGNYPVMVNHHLGGVFAHEAVGHACEADAVLQGSSVIKRLGNRVGSENITIIDDKTIEGNNGWVPYDDEGVKGERTILIQNGFLKGYLHNRETASEMNMNPTGNGRSMDLSQRAIPRMSTTFVDNGDSNYNEILHSIKDGYYLLGTLGGQVNPTTGEFLFNAQHGYKIINGELKYLVKNVGLTGNILKTLNEINLIGKDLKFNGGTCGKAGQWVPVSDGAPTFKIDNARVGGSE